MSCLNYHRATAHTYESVRRPHFLDWGNYPSPYKFYEGVKTFKLPPFKAATMETVDTLYRICADYGGDRLSLQEVANLAFAVNGITKVENFHGEPFGFRASPSAGALYPFELYLFLRELPPLPDGLYHYQPANHSLELLIEADLWEELQTALCAEVRGNVAAVITAYYPRSAWKYGSRSYRYCLLDSGHAAGNGVVFLRSLGLDSTALSLFKDDSLNKLLGVDGRKEFALIAVLPQRPALYWGEKEPEERPFPPSLPVLRRPVEEPLVEEAHRAGVLEDCYFYRPFPTDYPEDLPQVNSLTVAETLLKRRSRREFTGRQLSFEEFKFAVEPALNCFPADWGFPKTNLYLQVRSVEGLADGIYAVESGRLTPVKLGDFSAEMAYLALHQRFVGRANVNAVFTFNFEGSDCRQYRAANLEAGALGENLYLGAESLGLGACGIGAFYDFELQSFLGLPQTELPLYLVSVGAL